MDKRPPLPSPAGVATVVAAVAATALAARLVLPIPGSPVPQSAQTLAVLLTGALLGPGRGVAAMGAYLILGGAGLPLFADGAAGWRHLVGPTAGYLAGFVVAAGGVGRLAPAAVRRGLSWTVALMVAGHAVILGSGWARLAGAVGAAMAWEAGVRPFLWGGVVKSALAAVAVVLAHRASDLGWRGLDEGGEEV